MRTHAERLHDMLLARMDHAPVAESAAQARRAEVALIERALRVAVAEASER